MTRQYTRSELATGVENIISGDIDTTDLHEVLNRAARHVASSVDLRSCKRKASLSPNLFDDIYIYSAPSDLKSWSIVDVRPQVRRDKWDRWTLTTAEEFDRKKQTSRTDKFGDPINNNSNISYIGENLLAVREENFGKELLISRPIDDSELLVDALDSVGDWKAFGDGDNLTSDADNYVKGSGCINWDINVDGGTTAGIYNKSLDSFDISDYLSAGSVFVWTYLSDSTDVTNFILRVGNNSSNYYSITVTTDNAGNSLQDGWNLLRFDMSNKSETGTVDDDDCSYISIYMTKDSGKTDETDYRFDHVIFKIGDHYDVIYYSKYPWYTAAGSYAENASDDADLLNADTDELELIEKKSAELAELNLRNREAAKQARSDYDEAKERYTFKNPSESLTLIQRYYEF